jgi:hypothetical protein
MRQTRRLRLGGVAILAGSGLVSVACASKTINHGADGVVTQGQVTDRH